jgi:pimeloyl-ACP methyl ester carboxylesterase
VAVFHGNAEQLADQVPFAEEFADAGLGAYVIEYPGYGLSSDSSTTEANVYADAQAALRHLSTNLHVSRAELVLFGRSLGTGVAAEMARRGFGCRLILVSPYSSMVAMAARTTPFLPTAWLVQDRYDTLAKVGTIRQPTLVVHGAKDSLIPPEMGSAVAAQLPSGKLYLVPQAGHNDVLFVGGQDLWGELVAFARAGG